MATKKVDDERSKFVKELTKLSKKIEVEGLLFLIKQANVLIYNQEADKLNNKIGEIELEKKASNISTEDITKTHLEIIPDSDKKNYVLQVGSKRKFFTRGEFIEIAKIVHNNPKGDALPRMFSWFDNERRDFLIDCSIKDKNHHTLVELYDMIKSRYKMGSK